VGYIDGNYPDEFIEKITKTGDRKIEFVSKYGIIGKKKIKVYIIYPEK